MTSRNVTTGILQPLVRHGAPAAGFVTSKNVFVEGQVDERLHALRAWLDAGATLENHSWSHRSFQKTPLDEYEDDALRGDLVPRMLMGERGKEPRHYRHPFNHTGPTRAARRNFERFIGEHGYVVTPFTVEHADYVFNSLYVSALANDDPEEAERIGRAYVEQLDVALDFAEGLSRETFTREIPQILLIHANDINGRYLGEMLERLVARGYEFVSLDQAVGDAAYSTRDEYVGPTGISWLHRWRHSLGLPDKLREEPDPPRWVIDAWRSREPSGTRPAPKPQNGYTYDLKPAATD